SGPYEVTRKWLLDNFRMAEDHSVNHQNIAKFYDEFCTKENVKPLSTNLFVKLTRALYPSVLYRRMGKRVENNYIYEGLTVRAESKYQLRDQEENDEIQSKLTDIPKHPTKLQELIRKTLEMPIPSTADQSTPKSPSKSSETQIQSDIQFDIIHESSSGSNLSYKKTSYKSPSTNNFNKSDKTLPELSCPVCDRKFSLIFALNVHVRDHFLVESDNDTGNSEYKESVIDLENEVNDKVRKSEVKMTCETCPLCRIKVSDKESLNMHMQACSHVQQASSSSIYKFPSDRINQGLEISEKKMSYNNLCHKTKIRYENIIKCNGCLRVSFEKNKESSMNMNCVICKSPKRFALISVKDYFQIMRNSKITMLFECLECGLLLKDRKLIISHIGVAHQNIMLMDEPDALYETHSTLIGDYSLKNQEDTDSLHRSLLKGIEPQEDELRVASSENEDFWKEKYAAEAQKNSYECNICFKIFPYQSWLQRHIQNHNKVLTCHICSDTFTSFSYFKSHMEQVHKTPVPDKKEAPVSQSNKTGKNCTGNVNFESIPVEDDDMDDYDDYEDDDEFYYFEDDDDDDDSFEKECYPLTVGIVKPGKTGEREFQNHKSASPVFIDASSVAIDALPVALDALPVAIDASPVTIDNVTSKRIWPNSPQKRSIDTNKCPFCLTSFKNKDKLLHHIMTHKEMNNLITLTRNEMSANKSVDSLFHCSFCNKKFTTVDGLKVHEKKHKGKSNNNDLSVLQAAGKLQPKTVAEARNNKNNDKPIKSIQIKSKNIKDSFVFRDSIVNTTMEDPFVEDIGLEENVSLNEFNPNNSNVINLRIDPQNRIISVVQNESSVIEPLVNSITLIDNVSYLKNKLGSKLLTNNSISDKYDNGLSSNKDTLVLNSSKLGNATSKNESASKRKASSLQYNLNTIQESFETKRRKKNVISHMSKNEMDPHKYMGMKCEKGNILSVDKNKLAVTTICATCTNHFKPEFDLEIFKRLKLESTVSCPNCGTEFLYQCLWPELRLLFNENESTNIPKKTFSEELIDLTHSTSLNQPLK
ncbi:unnamed protein product, partial [Meganyctiphanes norvegica]